MTYHILEIANTHAGNVDYLLSLIDEFNDFEGYGMKFQPLHADMIATTDCVAYPLYQELQFSSAQWKEIIKKAAKTKEIWLDLFDLYGAQILNENREAVKGVKLQSSILFNEVLISKLEEKKLNNLTLIINISGYSIELVRERLNTLEERLQPSEIWIEVGFQSYPTKLEDSGFSKIHTIKDQFPNKIVFADHSEGKSEDAIWLPVIAALSGASILEKHIQHSTLETKYDHFSSMDIHSYSKFISILNSYSNLKNQPFINQSEHEYLTKSIQIPICKNDINSGKLVTFSKDLEYKRSGKSGLNTIQMKDLQESFHILAKRKEAGDTFQREDFKKANVAVIIACRLKSSRLPKKALLPIGTLPSVQRCIKSCLNIALINFTILATSTSTEDDELINHTYSPDVIFHRGDPDDVIQRYIDICDQLKIDVILRVTADNPFISNDIAEFLLHEHFASGADYTCGNGAAVGYSVEVINTEAMRKVKQHFKSANYSEYMTWYFQNNPEHFKLNLIDLPSKWARNYRLTLDYPEDLELYNEIDKVLSEKNLNYSSADVIDLLDNSELSKINGHLTQMYKADQSLIDTLNEVTKIK